MVGVDTSQYGLAPVMRDTPDWSRDEQSLFRGDSRTPAEIRADGGFRPPYETRPDWQNHPERNVADVAQHVGGNTNAFVSTSTDQGVARDFAISGHVYVINAPGGIYTDPSMRPSTGRESHGEAEVLFPGGINWDYVRGWHPVTYEPGNGFVMGDFVPNPDYGGDRTSTPADIQQAGQYGPSSHDATRTAEHGRQDDSPLTQQHSAERPGSLGDRMGRLDDPRLDALRPHLQSTDGGMSAFAPPSSSDARQRWDHQNEVYTANQVPRIPGQFVVDMHGSADAVRVGDTPLSPRDLADIIRANPDYDGGPVSLLGCGTGSTPDGFAARLAQELGVPVTAPNTDAWVDHNGNVFASSPAYNQDTSKPARPTWPPNGEWNTYSPTGEHTVHRGPFPPGHTPSWAGGEPTGAAHRGDPPRSDDDTPQNTDDSDDGDDGDRIDDQDDDPRDLAERTGDPGANEDRDAAVAETAALLGITDPDQIRALGHAYEVAREYTAPVIVDVASRVHDDVAAAVAANPDRRVVFLGRDGHSLALATRTMEPDFFNQHCSEIVLSRAVVESAMRDLENSGVRFEGIDEFRVPKKVDEALLPGAAQRLEDYLANQGIPVNRPGAEISLVDTSYKGTVQELLAAAYPDVDFQGHYAFHGQEPTDPHPDNKKGYLVDLGPEVGRGRPLGELTDDHALTWAHQDAVGSIEETLNGTLSSPIGIGPDGPVQRPQHLEEDQTNGINPTKIDPAFTDPRVREGAKAVAMRAVADAAEHAVARREAGADWRGELSSSVERTRDQVRAWVGDDTAGTDPRFREVMDSMVRRDDKKIVIQLTDTMAQLNMDPAAQRAVWDAYNQCETKTERKRFAADLAERGGLP
jgi:hypothetical protein